MRVKILESDKRFGIEKDDIFEAKRYQYDPHEKVSLLRRESDGFDPECNQYNHNIATWIQGQWMVLDGNRYIPEA